MNIFRGRKMSWLRTGLCAAAMASVFSYTCEAASFDSLREAKQAAWEECKIVKTRALPISFSGIQTIDGAVGADGSAKVIIDGWGSQAISADGKAVEVYADEKSDECIGVMLADTLVTVILEEKDRVLVKSGNLTGYVDKEKLSYGIDARRRADEICPSHVITDGSDVGILAGISSQGKVLSYMAQRVPYQVIEEKDGWYRVTAYEGAEGYVSADRVKPVRIIHLAQDASYGDEQQKAYVTCEVTEEERIMLAAIVFCEARGENFEGKKAVASVVINRMKSGAFPNTVEEVVRQKGQFEPVSTGAFDFVLEEPGKISESCYEAVDAVLQGQNNAGDALYFSLDGRGEKIGIQWFR